MATVWDLRLTCLLTWPRGSSGPRLSGCYRWVQMVVVETARQGWTTRFRRCWDRGGCSASRRSWGL